MSSRTYDFNFFLFSSGNQWTIRVCHQLTTHPGQTKKRSNSILQIKATGLAPAMTERVIGVFLRTYDRHLFGGISCVFGSCPRISLESFSYFLCVVIEKLGRDDVCTIMTRNLEQMKTFVTPHPPAHRRPNPIPSGGMVQRPEVLPHPPCNSKGPSWQVRTPTRYTSG